MTSGEIIVYPIQIRPDVVVRVHLPIDLTKEEAERVSRVILAMARDNGELTNRGKYDI